MEVEMTGRSGSGWIHEHECKMDGFLTCLDSCHSCRNPVCVGTFLVVQYICVYKAHDAIILLFYIYLLFNIVFVTYCCMM